MTDATTTAEPDAVARGPIVETSGLTKRFGDQVAVDDVDLVVPAGTIFGFIGPSGSGKTTTVRLLTGVQSPSSGSVAVWGIDPSSFTERERANIGYMPQLSVLFPHLSIAENLRFVASIYGMSWGSRGRLRDVLEFVELSEHRRKRLRDASGGMQRRLALASALVNDANLLFLDEPTAGIDPVLRRKFWDRFEALRDEGRTLFVTTQYVGEAAYCDRIGVLREGKLLTVDTPDGLRRQAYGGEVIDLVIADRVEQELVSGLTRLDYVTRAQRTRVDGRGLRVTVPDADHVIPNLQRWLDEQGVTTESIDRWLPPFDDVFVELVQREPSDDLEELDDAIAAQQPADGPESSAVETTDAQEADADATTEPDATDTARPVESAAADADTHEARNHDADARKAGDHDDDRDRTDT